jgi:secretion/DNA translocation related TadE-like protein
MTSDDSERGSATIWTLTAAALVLAVAYACVLVAAAYGARQRAAAAADLAALAGAARLADGDPCAAAERVVAANGAQLAACSYDATSVAVTAAVPVPPALRGLGAGPATARARAGPVG